jgi:hypothetical protein
VPGERETRLLVRALAFLWPARWTATTRGLRLCIIATYGLAGAIAGLAVGVYLTVR